MMWSIVFFCWRLSLNLISTLYQAQKLKLMEMHTPSLLRTIYAHYTTGLDSDVLHDLVPFVQFKKREKHPWRSATFSKVFRLKAFIFTKNNRAKHHIRICYQYVRIEKLLAATYFGKLQINGNLVVQSKVPPHSGSLALRQLNPIHKKNL